MTTRRRSGGSSNSCLGAGFQSIRGNCDMETTVRSLHMPSGSHTQYVQGIGLRFMVAAPVHQSRQSGIQAMRQRGIRCAGGRSTHDKIA